MRFAVFTHVEHKIKGRIYFAYGPYLREMNLWSEYVEEMEVIATLRNSHIVPSELPYLHRKLLFTSIPSFNLTSIKDGFGAILRIPKVFFQILKVMERADHLHLRCPGNVGLLACVAQMFFPKKIKTAKYAGNWDPNAEQPWSYKLQKWILGNSFLTKNMTVLVYGNWKGQSKNIKPFFTASFSKEEIPVGLVKNFESPYEFLFVGSLVQGKRPRFAIELVNELRKRNLPVQLRIFGEGPEKKHLEEKCKREGLDFIQFMGNRSLEDLKAAYKEAHFCILASKSEGWPKAIAEAMFFGCVPIATSVSCVPWMLGQGERGILLEGCKENGEAIPIAENVERIASILQKKEELRRMSALAMEWSQEYTLEKFEAGILEILEQSKFSEKR